MHADFSRSWGDWGVTVTLSIDNVCLGVLPLFQFQPFKSGWINLDTSTKRTSWKILSIKSNNNSRRLPSSNLSRMNRQLNKIFDCYCALIFNWSDESIISFVSPIPWPVNFVPWQSNQSIYRRTVVLCRVNITRPSNWWRSLDNLYVQPFRFLYSPVNCSSISTSPFTSEIFVKPFDW